MSIGPFGSVYYELYQRDHSIRFCNKYIFRSSTLAASVLGLGRQWVTHRAVGACRVYRQGGGGRCSRSGVTRVMVGLTAVLCNPRSMNLLGRGTGRDLKDEGSQLAKEDLSSADLC